MSEHPVAYADPKHPTYEEIKARLNESGEKGGITTDEAVVMKKALDEIREEGRDTMLEADIAAAINYELEVMRILLDGIIAGVLTHP